MLLAPTTPLTLAEVQALRPPAGDAGSLRTAIAQAEAAREAALDRAEAIEIHMAAAILTASDEALEHAEREVSMAKRGADRLTALLDAMRADLAAAEGDAALTALQTHPRAPQRHAPPPRPRPTRPAAAMRRTA